ncbi:MAG: hypothetical protein K0R65_1854 [Crocinitomicaceae bacterium]|jgi:hypothetical protein|nr:hypothetical protein [Crocinitomicaceae bacterium]
MKNWLLIISFFSVLQALACGPFYPYGDEVRFSLLKPNYVPVYGMGRFHYTAFAFSDSYTAFEKDEFEKSDENIAAWHSYFKGEFSHKDIYEVIYKVKVKQLGRMKKNNAFVKALYSDRYKAVLDYIVFAKKISDLNAWSGDPWERDRNSGKSLRSKQITKAIQSAEAAKDENLKRRYAYLAVRLAFYNNDYEQIKKLYAAYFEGQTPKDVVHYWALHFKVNAEESSARRNAEVAQVFRYSHEKRFPVHFMYDFEIDKSAVLKACRNEEEKSAVEFFLTSRKVDRALPEIKRFAAGNTDENLLCFLLLRETNKLEDWILTPYYSEFAPALNQEYYEREDYFSFRKRIAGDRKCAAELADWAGKQEIKDASKKAWWKSMTAYLYFMAGDEKLETAKDLLVQKSDDPALLRFNKMLGALISAQQNDKANLENEQLQQIVRSESDLGNDKFLFALGRELEYKGNTTDAAYLFSKINKGADWENYTFWRSKELHNTLFLDFYEHYFFYLDAQYTPEQVAALIKDSKMNTTSDFDQWKKQGVKKDLARLYDLLGTKYLRQNKLEASLKAFEQVNDSLWKSRHFYYRDYIDANPFYTDFYSEHAPTKGDTVRYTKPEIVRQLIYYLDQADHKTGKEKAYYAFQAGNCYFNMTQYGNSWMMRRYFWTSQATHTGLEDDDEYFQCKLAQKYYLEASFATKNEEISALALRMAGRCEKYRLYDLNRDYEGDDYEGFIFGKNKYYQKLKQEYPDHYEPLISNCQTFTSYYAKLK